MRSHPHFHLLVTDGAFFPDGTFYPLGYWDVDSLHDVIRTAVLKSLVARQCLHQASADILASWPRERSGFSVFVGPELTLPQQHEDVTRVLRYILRSALPLKRLRYDEATARVDYLSVRRHLEKSWPHAVDFLADFAQHIPRARQHQVTYAGYFANALGHLKAKANPAELPEGTPTGQRRTPWAALVRRTWATDPEACPGCGQTMQRSRPLYDQSELHRLLANLGIGRYPIRPRSPPPPDPDDTYFLEEPSTADAPTPWPADSDTQIPPGWDEWDAA